MKEESENVDLILNIQKLRSGIRSHHFIANRWRTIETVRDFILGGSEITADSDCSHETKRGSLLGRKAVTSLDSILKSRDITLSTKVQSKLWFFQ